jgi:4-hydroxybenzoate polyprenyltransferase
MATPALGALLWLGTFPSVGVIILGLITAFAGYTAVYALNDVIGYRTDKEKIQQSGPNGLGNDLDAVFVRHPLAQGLLSFKEALLWALAWALLALIGAYKLNPICVLIFLSGCALETVYCLLLRVSHLRAIVSGAVKTSGAIAAVFAVDTNPSLNYLVVLFLWLFFWEIGGQNVPNDWADMEEDRRMQAKTIPVRFGPKWAILIILGSLVLAVAMNVVLFQFPGVSVGLPYVAASLILGLYLLLIPAYRLYRTKKRIHALALFNRASYYPLASLAVVMTKILL